MIPAVRPPQGSRSDARVSSPGVPEHDPESPGEHGSERAVKADSRIPEPGVEIRQPEGELPFGQAPHNLPAPHEMLINVRPSRKPRREHRRHGCRHGDSQGGDPQPPKLGGFCHRHGHAICMHWDTICVYIFCISATYCVLNPNGNPPFLFPEKISF